jgi:hypothetical protein
VWFQQLIKDSSKVSCCRFGNDPQIGANDVAREDDLDTSVLEVEENLAEEQTGVTL